jgi:hypothetical protein
MERLQDWPVTDGEQVRSFRRLMVNTCPGRGHENIAGTPFEAYAIDYRATGTLEDDVDRTARLAPGGCAFAWVDAMHFAGKDTHYRASGEGVHKLQAVYRTTTRPVQRFERALGLSL